MILAVFGLSGCDSGDDYEGFDNSISNATPNRFLAFFNRQGDLAPGSYTIVAATATAGQAGDFTVVIDRRDGSSEEIINGSWISSGGLDSDRTCASGNRCYSFNSPSASGAIFTLSSELDGVLYLVDDSDTGQVVASANDNAAGIAETLAFSDSEIDETSFASAYYAAVDPGNARDTAQKFWSLHQFDAPEPEVNVIFRDSKDLGYGRDMYMRSYSNASVGSSCGPPGAVTIAFFVRNFSVEVVDGFAYGPVNLQAAIAEDLQHHVGSNAIEFGYGRDDIPGEACSDEPMAKFFTYSPIYRPNDAPHPRLDRTDLDGRGAKAMPQPCITCHGGKLRPLDRFGRLVAIHANDTQAQIGDVKGRMQPFEVDTFEFSTVQGHRRADYEESLRLLNSAIYCTYPGSAGHPACADYGGGVAAQTDTGEWSGDFAREMLLGWYGNELETSAASFDSSFVPDGWTPSAGGPPVGADLLFTKVVGPNCFVCHGKLGTQKGTAGNTAGKDIDFSNWDKFCRANETMARTIPSN